MGLIEKARNCIIVAQGYLEDGNTEAAAVAIAQAIDFLAEV